MEEEEDVQDGSFLGGCMKLDEEEEDFDRCKTDNGE